MIEENKKDINTSSSEFWFNGNNYTDHSNLPNSETALYRLSNAQKIFFVVFGILLVTSFILNFHLTLIAFIFLLNLIYFSDILFNLFLVIRSYRKPPEIVLNDEELRQFSDENLPKYTVLCPLYKEAAVVPQFMKAMSELDYPKDKLQVMLLLEEDDMETVGKIRRMNLPSYFQIVIVPHSMPKTKPKALNYGLNFATGEMIVIYDAEDVPEKDQLKKAVIAFAKSGSDVKCIQAKLNFYNPKQNILTRVFTAEYSLWFDLILTGLQSIHAPIPLGGTSNHFRKQDMIELQGWDSFNVTEDCDLGMRIVKKGYRTAIIDSTTFEEANSNALNWFAQRTRWIKGYAQTYLVHMRKPHEFITKWNRPHVFTFQLVVGGKVASMLINPIMWTLTIIYFLFRSHIGTSIEHYFPPVVFYMSLISVVFGNFLYFYYYMIGCAHRKQYDLIIYVFLVPLYWLAMSLAAYVSIFKLIKQPHHWSKTKHGLHLPKINNNVSLAN